MNANAAAAESDAGAIYDRVNGSVDDMDYAGFSVMAFFIGAIIGLIAGIVGAVQNLSFWRAGYPIFLIILGGIFLAIIVICRFVEKELSASMIEFWGCMFNVLLGEAVGYIVFYAVVYWLAELFVYIWKFIFG